MPIVPVFETASIKPNNGEPMAGFTIVGKPFKAIMWQGDRLMATNFTLHGLIQVAYGVPDDQIVGGSDWLNTEGYDLDAKMGKSVVDDMQKRGRVYGVSGRTLMFQKLLSERFKLSFHRETKELPVYALVIAKGGPKLHEAKHSVMRLGRGELTSQGVGIALLARTLSRQLGRPVLDKTGLPGYYEFTLHWTPDESQTFIGFDGTIIPDNARPPDSSWPSVFAAVQEQLGLKLESQKGPVEILVIDHVEKPSEN